MQDAESNFRTLLVEMVRGSDPRWGDWWPRLQKDVQGRATNPALARPEAEALFRDHVVHLAASAEKGGGPSPPPARPCAEVRPPHECGSHMSSQTEWHAVLTGHRSDHVCGNEVLFCGYFDSIFTGWGEIAYLSTCKQYEVYWFPWLALAVR